MINGNFKQAVDVLQNTAKLFQPSQFQIWFKEGLHPLIKSETERAYSNEGIPKWDKLSEKYAKYKQSHFPGPILVGPTKRLKSWITNADYNTTGLSYFFPKDVNTVDYYKRHQTGTSKMPQRQIVGLIPGSDSKIINSLSEWLVRRLRIIGWR